MSPDGNHLRRKPEEMVLYEVVRDNLATLPGAKEDGALTVRLPEHTRDELTGYLDCGLRTALSRLHPRNLQRCPKTHLVALWCKG